MGDSDVPMSSLCSYPLALHTTYHTSHHQHSSYPFTPLFFTQSLSVSCLLSPSRLFSFPSHPFTHFTASHLRTPFCFTRTTPLSLTMSSTNNLLLVDLLLYYDLVIEENWPATPEGKYTYVSNKFTSGCWLGVFAKCLPPPFRLHTRLHFISFWLQAPKVNWNSTCLVNVLYGVAQCIMLWRCRSFFYSQH